MVLLKNREPSSMASVKEFLDLKYSWVQRWGHNKAAVQLVRPRLILSGEPQSSKAALYDFERKQFPSIAAMAWMGKAMNLLLADVSVLPTKVINYVSRTSKMEIKVQGYYELHYVEMPLDDGYLMVLLIWIDPSHPSIGCSVNRR
ncbi:hypothetical protein NE237_011484 [Protea cynaroides]|uniref:Uncharacterized protein n=1 Tax=Protea cynaroides TaxID=273540 RepID=A0A9Q0GX54_9MAGN|nr:hypothetical protein NE237_011484 [Protea cynaroides]